MRAIHSAAKIRSQAFTLLELLVVIAIIAVLAAMLLPAISRGKESARGVQCLGQLRQLGTAVRLYADDNRDHYPRSQHSAFAHGELPWGRALAPFLGSTPAQWTNLLKTVYRCPSDVRTTPWSYGMNVYFELGPDDDYLGKPQTWRRTLHVPRPSAAILFAENSGGADHIMPHFWLSARDASEVAQGRHGKTSNYIFADGHAQAQQFRMTYEPGSKLDCWNPLLAR